MDKSKKETIDLVEYNKELKKINKQLEQEKNEIYENLVQKCQELNLANQQI